jgi:hypothetical protein
MNNYQYDKPLRETYQFPAAVLTAAAVVGRFIGPAGKVGRVTNLAHVITTDTDAATALAVDTNAGLAAPVTQAVANAPGQYTGAAVSRTLDAGSGGIVSQTELPADTVVEVQVTDATPTAGAGDITVTVEWY